MAKILIVCNYDFAFNKFMIPFVNKLINMGHEVGVACDGNKFDYEKVIGKITFHNIKMPRKISLRGFFSSIYVLRKIVKNNSYDVVNSNNRNASFIARIALITLIFSKVRSAYTARGMYFHDNQNFFEYHLTFYVEIFLLFFTHVVLSQSEEDVRKLSRNILVNSSKLNIIHNGISHEKFYIKNVKKTDLKIKGLVLCTIGRIVEGKGLIDLVNAFSILTKTHPNSSLLIIGGVLHEENNFALKDFWDRAEQLNIKEKIIITGMVDNVEDYLALADIYIHPSYREGVPRSVLEAMSLEKIVIATKIRGANEIINTNEVGILYQKGNIKELVQSIKKVNNLPLKDKKNMGFMARKRVLELYKEELYVDRQVQFINKVI
jgi:glycosyltransferase involved in cell wall biosynthesis